MKTKINFGRHLIVGAVLSSVLLAPGCAELKTSQEDGSTAQSFNNSAVAAAYAKVDTSFEGYEEVFDGEGSGQVAVALALKKSGNQQEDIAKARKLAVTAQSQLGSSIASMSESDQGQIISTLVCTAIVTKVTKMNEIVALYKQSTPAANEEARTTLVFAAAHSGKPMGVINGWFNLLNTKDLVGTGPDAHESAATLTYILARGSLTLEQTKSTFRTIKQKFPPSQVTSNHTKPDHEDLATLALAFAASKFQNPGAKLETVLKNFDKANTKLKQAEAAAMATFAAALGGQSIDTALGVMNYILTTKGMSSGSDDEKEATALRFLATSIYLGASKASESQNFLSRGAWAGALP